MESVDMIFPMILLSLFLFDAVFWGMKMVFPHWWIERKARRILARGKYHYLLFKWGWHLFFLLARLFSAAYMYFSLFWISFSCLGILLLLFTIISTTFVHYILQQRFESFENGNVPDEWRMKEREDLYQGIVLSFLIRGFFLISWLKTFPLFPLHLSGTQEHIISVIAGVSIVVGIVRKVLQHPRKAADQQQRPSPIFRTREDIDRKDSLMAEIIPNAYDFYGREVAESGKGHYLLRPTFPMERFISTPLSHHFDDIEAVRRFLETCEYVSDMEQFGQQDYWMPPELFERRKKGDCEDFSLYVWRQLMHMGYSTRFVVGWRFMRGHAWVTLEQDGKQYIVEPLASPISHLRLTTIGYKPKISVKWDGSSFHYYAHHRPFYVPSWREMVFLVCEVRDSIKALSRKRNNGTRDSWLENAVLCAFGLFMLVVELIRREAPLHRLLQLFKLILTIPLFLIALLWFNPSRIFRFIATLPRKIWTRIFRKSPSPSPLSRKRKRGRRKRGRRRKRRKR
jgi:hypothetical protein